MDSFCISLIIPSTYEDFIRCKNVLEISIYNSTYCPYEVIIIISGVENYHKFNTVYNFHFAWKCIKRIIIKYRKNSKNAASNRNYGYYLSSCPILSYFDVDDIMSIHRMYVVNKIFRENKNIDIFFHPSTKHYSILKECDKNLSYDENIVVNQYKTIKEKCRKSYLFDGRIYKCDVSNGFYITNGWPSLKRKIMKNIKFNESLHATEDLDFISKVVRRGYNVGIFKKPLGFYIKDNKCEKMI